MMIDSEVLMMLYFVLALHAMAYNGFIIPVWLFVLCWWILAVKGALKIAKAVRREQRE